MSHVINLLPSRLRRPARAVSKHSEPECTHGVKAEAHGHGARVLLSWGGTDGRAVSPCPVTEGLPLASLEQCKTR